MNVQENGSIVDKEIVVENKVDLDIGSFLFLYKGDNNVEKEMGESLIIKEVFIKINEVVLYNISRNELGIFVFIQINGRKCRFLVDFGFDVIIINMNLLERCFEWEIFLLELYWIRLDFVIGDLILCGGKYEV